MEQLRLMEQAAEGQTAMSARVISMTATTAEGVVRRERSAGSGSSLGSGIVWLIRAEGTFTNSRTPPGVAAIVASSGYVIISDADGAILGSGFP